MSSIFRAVSYAYCGCRGLILCAAPEVPMPTRPHRGPIAGRTFLARAVATTGHGAALGIRLHSLAPIHTLLVFVLLCAMFLSPFVGSPKEAHAATFVVTNTNDSGAGSLRQAIIDANNSPGFDNITFNIPGGGV